MTSNVKFRFSTAFIFVGILLVVNVVLMFINDSIHSEMLTFLGNTLSISFVFPAVVLYWEKRESFHLLRYLYFVGATFIATAIVCYLFVFRF